MGSRGKYVVQPPRLNWLKRDYLAGFSLKELEARYGCSDSYIRSRLLRAGVSLRQSGWRAKKGTLKANIEAAKRRLFARP